MTYAALADAPPAADLSNGPDDCRAGGPLSGLRLEGAFSRAYKRATRSSPSVGLPHLAERRLREQSADIVKRPSTQARPEAGEGGRLPFCVRGETVSVSSSKTSITSNTPSGRPRDRRIELTASAWELRREHENAVAETPQHVCGPERARHCVRRVESTPVPHERPADDDRPGAGVGVGGHVGNGEARPLHADPWPLDADETGFLEDVVHTLLRPRLATLVDVDRFALVGESGCSELDVAGIEVVPDVASTETSRRHERRPAPDERVDDEVAFERVQLDQLLGEFDRERLGARPDEPIRSGSARRRG